MLIPSLGGRAVTSHAVDVHGCQRAGAAPLNVRRRRTTHSLTMRADKNPEDDDKKSGDSGNGTNWDESWKSFKETGSPIDSPVKGGTFKFQDSGSKSRDDIDKRTEALTDAWTNPDGFLFGIIIILLIAVFYVFAWTYR